MNSSKAYGTQHSKKIPLSKKPTATKSQEDPRSERQWFHSRLTTTTKILKNDLSIRINTSTDITEKKKYINQNPTNRIPQNPQNFMNENPIRLKHQSNRILPSLSFPDRIQNPQNQRSRSKKRLRIYHQNPITYSSS